MARPLKPGLDYSEIDCDYSRKGLALKVRKRFPGFAGMAVLYEVLSWINEGKGCFVEVDSVEDAAEQFCTCRLFDISLCGQVEEIFAYMLEIGFFDKEAFDRDKILTSEGITRRWWAAKKHPDAYDLPYSIQRYIGGFGTVSEPKLLDNAPKLPDNEPKLLDNAPKVLQSRVKKSKVYSTPPTPPTGGDGGEEENDDLPFEVETVIDSWNETFPEGDPRHLNGPPYSLNGFFLPNLHKSLSEGITLDQFRDAFRSLRDGPHAWQLHSAVKPDNVRMLLTERQRASPSKRPAEKDYTNPQDYLALGAIHG